MTKICSKTCLAPGFFTPKTSGKPGATWGRILVIWAPGIFFRNSFSYFIITIYLIFVLSLGCSPERAMDSEMTPEDISDSEDTQENIKFELIIIINL